VLTNVPVIKNIDIKLGNHIVNDWAALEEAVHVK